MEDLFATIWLHTTTTSFSLCSPPLSPIALLHGPSFCTFYFGTDPQRPMPPIRSPSVFLHASLAPISGQPWRTLTTSCCKCYTKPCTDSGACAQARAL